MKLFGASASPFVRKVRVYALELGLADRIEDAPVAITPIAPDDALNDANPLGKIPALALDDGRTLYDSRVVCDYLGILAKVGGSDDQRIDSAVRQALGDGICDAAISKRYETFLRPEQFRWEDWVNAQQGKVDRGVAAMAVHVAKAPADRFDLGDVACACALAYLDFRYPDNNWRANKTLAAWFEKAAARDSMQATQPA